MLDLLIDSTRKWTNVEFNGFKMHPTEKKLFEDSESYLSELIDNDFDIQIDSFNVFNKNILESSELVTSTSLGVNGTAVSAISSPDCGVSIKEMA